MIAKLLGNRTSQAPSPGIVNPGRQGIALDSALLHITHWKAGSQWFRKILEALFEPAVLDSDGSEDRLFRPGLKCGVFPCVYLSAEELSAVDFGAECRRLIIVRDLRDTLISGYFSLRNSHASENAFVAKWRNVLKQLNEEDGLLYLLDHWLPYSAMIQNSWLDSGETLVHFEDLATGAIPLGDLFRKHWKLDVSTERIESIQKMNSFSRLSGGREPGVEDRENHYRNGMVGDWRNHFTGRIRNSFVERHGRNLIRAGYEQNFNWDLTSP